MRRDIKRFYNVNLVGWDKEKQVYSFDICSKDVSTKETESCILASYDVKDGKVCERLLEQASDGFKDEAGHLLPEAGKAAESLSDLVLDYWICGKIEKAQSFEELYSAIAPAERDDLSWEQEKSFVLKTYDLYEKEGFSQGFHTPYQEDESRNGQPFTVLERISPDNEGFYLEGLPMWRIEFADGKRTCAFPEEIMESEQKCR